MENEKDLGIINKVKSAFEKTIHNIKENVKDRVAVCRSSWKKIAAGAMVLVVFATSAGVYKSLQGYKVFFNGEELGMVRYTSDFMRGLELVNEDLSEEYGVDIVFPSDITFERAIIDQDVLMETPEETAEAIQSTDLTLSVEGAVIVIEGEDVVVLASYEEAEEVLQSVINSFALLGENEVIISEPIITQDYEIVSRLVPYESIRDTESAATYIMQGADVIYEYEVQSGDTSWNIAVNRGMRVSELEVANPDMDIADLHPGDVLKLTEVVPYLDVEVVKEVVYTENIAYGTTYQSDATIYVGTTKEISAGVYGEKEITAIVTTQNGVEVDREVTSEVTLSDPVDRVVARGTKALPPAQGTGRFGIPTYGRVTAINKAGSHAGSRAVDIANSTGTPIYASDAGVVTKASWYSGYGYCVIIDHGNGYSTLYGHLSSMSVSVGQNVSKGQRIASMGSTGNSTGPHLHFEIRYNGVRQVITKYFSNLRVGGYVSP